jgi:hypothetical protein
MARIIHHLERSFNAYRKFFPIIIAAVLIAAIPPLIITGFGFLVASNFSVSGAESLAKETYFSENSNLWQESALPSPLESIGFMAFVLVAVLLSFYLLAGTYQVCLGAIKGKTSLSLFFDSINARGFSLVASKILLGLVFGGILMATILVGIILAVIIGLASSGANGDMISILFVILAVVLMISVAPFFTLISPSVVSGKSVVEAFRESFKIGRKNYLEVLLLLMVMVVFEIVAYAVEILSPILGVIVALLFVSPMIALLISSFYLENSAARKTNQDIGANSKTKKAVVAKKIKMRKSK